MFGTIVVPLDESLGRRAGVLQARAGRFDAIDADLVAMRSSGEQIVTSDPHDIAALADAARLDVDILLA